ncbi:hypothetical protein GmHk_01G000641 [Glycine max]|nr:hypothetical protein GmHk_01G000641 [Glycine max]
MIGLKFSALNQLRLLTAISTIDDLNYLEKIDTYYIVNIVLEGCEAFFERKNKEKNPGVARLWEGGITEINFTNQTRLMVIESYSTKPLLGHFYLRVILVRSYLYLVIRCNIVMFASTRCKILLTDLNLISKTTLG